MSLKEILFFIIFVVLWLAFSICAMIYAQDRNFGYIAESREIRMQKQETIVKSERKISENWADDGRDVYLYRPLVELLQESELSRDWIKERNGAPCLRAYDQGNIGSCVGNATALCVTIRAAWEIAEDNDPEELIALASADGIYGLARQKSGLLGRNFDGATGSGAAEAIRDLGTLWQLRYKSHDLERYDVQRCKIFGRNGVGQELLDEASQHKVCDIIAIQTFDDAWRCLGHGIPINVCSSVGFETKRDATGTCKPRGSWGHSMAVIGRRTLNGNRQVLIQNSWGDDWNQGDYAGDMPWGSFWVDEPVFSRMINENDTYGYANFCGFETEDDGGFIWKLL